VISLTKRKTIVLRSAEDAEDPWLKMFLTQNRIVDWERSPHDRKGILRRPPWYVVFSVQTGETFSYSVSTRG